MKIVNSNAVREIDEIMQLFNDFLEKIINAFIKHRLSLEYELMCGDFTRRSRQILSRFYATTKQTHPPESLYIQGATLNFSKIFFDILRLSTLVETKVKEKILFSDEAVNEMKEIFQRTRGLLPHLHDALLTGNAIIIEHIKKEAAALQAKTLDHTVLHEERLCKGICHPRAAVIYMQMLQQLQDILWHFGALVDKENGIPNA